MIAHSAACRATVGAIRAIKMQAKEEVILPLGELAKMFKKKEG
jgi:hypothetical protein